MRSLSAVVLLLLGAPTQPTSPVVVPDGWVADVHVQVPGPLSLRRIDGELYIGAHNAIWKGTTLVVEGDFLAAAIDRAPDGTWYVADTLWTSWGVANLWKFTPGQTLAMTGFKYCQGVCVLPDGEVLAVDVGWINTTTSMDGKILRLDGTVEIPGTPLRNPVSLEPGPDGYLYFLDRGFLSWEPGRLLRFKPGDAAAEVVLEGLNDPFDTAWAPDGSLFITDKTKLLRWVPGGAVETWASGFGEAHGVDVAPNGDIFVADPVAGVVWRIHPAAVQIGVTFEPQTLNLKSRGQGILVKLGAPASSAALVAVDGASVGPVPVVGGKLDRAAVIPLLAAGDRLLRVEGTLADGTPFWAEGWVRAIQ